MAAEKENKKKKKVKKRRFNYSEAEKNRIFIEEFYIHSDFLFSRALYFTKDKDAANDLVQDTFLNCFRNINQYEVGTNAKAWLALSMRNHFLNEIKRTPYTTELSYVPSSKQLDREIGLNSFSDEYLEMLNQLRNEEKYPFLLSVVEGYMYEEIAEILELPVGTIRTQIFRAKKSLQEYIKNKTDKENGSII